jgi:DNA polymerase-1
MSKELIIVDGYALMYRAYYAMYRNPLINSKGENTSAVHGFTNYMLKLKKLFPTAHYAITFDVKGGSFRNKMFTEYKANRKPMPEDLRPQIPLIKKLVDLMGLPLFEMAGFEADDLIAAFSKFAGALGWSVKIVSKDKDLMQLVTDRVHLYAPETGGRFIEFGPEEVKKKMGVAPVQVHDLLALMGDGADNIPGIPGVGPKSAIKMLEVVDSVPKMIENPELLGTPKMTKKVVDNLDSLKMSYELVKLADDIGLDYNEESFICNPLLIDEIKDFFKEVEFTHFLKDPFFSVQSQPTISKQASDVPMQEELLFQALENEEPAVKEFPFETKIVKNRAEVEEIVALIKRAGLFSVDTETTSLVRVEAEIVGISIALNMESGWYIPVGHKEGNSLTVTECLEILKPVLEDKDIHKIGQNLKYDYQVFKNYGVTLAGISFDTMIAAYLIEPQNRNNGMDALAFKWLDYTTVHIEELIGKGKKQISFADVVVADAAPYAVEDVVIPLMLKEKLEHELKERDLFKLFSDIEIPLLTVLAEMEYRGVSLDLELLAKLSEEYTKIVKAAEISVYEQAGEEFLLSSPKQLSVILFDKLGLPHGKKTKTGYSTNVDVLEKLAPDYPIVEQILVFRGKQKLLSTYINAFPEKISKKTGKLHTSFNQTIASTGRLSSSEPNLQNIPNRTVDGRKIREAFVAEEGKLLIAADYSQIELRLLAHFADDPVLIEAFKNGEDIHKQTAAAVYGIMPELVTKEMRSAAKTINFGLMYGMGPHKLSGELGISYGEAKKFIEEYFAQFPTIRNFIDSSVEKAKENGFSETLFERKLPLPALFANNKMVREGAERLAVNAVVQGTGADIVKIAMINIQNRIDNENLPLKMLMQVHDELVFEVDADSAEKMKDLVVDEMSRAVEISVPLLVEADVANSWSEAH